MDTLKYYPDDGVLVSSPLGSSDILNLGILTEVLKGFKKKKV
jgi:hypothetical protein